MTQLESKLIMKLAQVEGEKIILKDKIKRAIEYIGNYEEYCDEKECYCTPKYFEHLLEILGEKE